MKLLSAALRRSPAYRTSFVTEFFKAESKHFKPFSVLHAVGDEAKQTTSSDDGKEKTEEKKINQDLTIRPFRNLLSLSPFEAMDRMFYDDFFATPRLSSRLMPMSILRDFDREMNSILRRTTPAYEVSEDNKEFKLSIDLPGVRPEDCTVELENEGRILHISGGRKIEKDGSFSETRFDQRFSLAENLDKEKMSANLSEGLMVITVPKLEVEEKKKSIIEITSKPHIVKDAWEFIVGRVVDDIF